MISELIETLLKEDESEEEHDKWIAFDFDGVCAQYEDWEGVDVFGDPINEVAELTKELRQKGYKTLLYTTRETTPALREYLDKNGFEFDAINSSDHNPDDASSFKPIAELYVDDRALRFDQKDPGRSVQEVRRLIGKVDGE